MSESANVTSVQALDDFRAALCIFAQKAAEALSAADAEIHRAADWLDDQQKAWQVEVRRAEDKVFQARTELQRRKMMRIGDRPPDCSEQEEALHLARHRLEHAEDQVERTHRWERQWKEAVIDYRGPVGQLKTLLEGDLPRACALLERKSAALEAYVGLAAPPGAARTTPTPPQSTDKRSTP